MAVLSVPRRARRDRLVALGFVLLAFGVAFAQRPGWSTSDTKVDLHVDPLTFLGQVASLWSPRIGLGAVQSAQYSGYLWPMGSLFAALHALGVSAWVAERIWLGAIYALAAWGMLRLMDVLAGERRGIAHGVAALFFMLNPYTVTFTGRTSVTLLGYAALPWLLVVVHRGVRSVDGPLRGMRGWAWAGAFALILTSLGGGINAAVVAWVMVGPLVLLVYEPLIRDVRWRDATVFAARVVLVGVVASLWWLVPLLLYSRYGVDFLQYTEQPFTIWATNSSTEVLRLMGYWTSYIGVGFHGLYAPYSSEAGILLFNPLVVGASLLLPALAVAAFAWCRRWRYAPFLLLLILVAAVIEIAAFPAGTPARGVLQWLYDHLAALRFLRTTQKAAPLVAVGLAGLLGVGAERAWRYLLGWGARWRGRLVTGTASAGLLALIVLAALPLVRGTGVEKQLMWKRIPLAWTRAGRQLQRTLPANTRALVLPGQIFAFYRWGGTVDPILPRLTRRPVAVREETPYEDPHAADLLITIDSLVQQVRLFPKQLLPLLRLAGAGAVVTGTDDDIRRSGAIDPLSAAATLAGQGLGRPSASYGPVRTFAAANGQLQPPQRLPEVRRYDVTGSLGLVHVEPASPPTIVDGSAEGLATMAAFGQLPLDRPLFYAADMSARALQRAASTGANVVITDSNRRRAFLPQFVSQDVGVTLTARQRLGENLASLNPFAIRGPSAQTVAVLQGASYLRTPTQAGYAAFPEHAPIAAFDGNPSTSWVADRYLPPYDRWIEIGFDRRRDVSYVDLEPIRDPFGIEEDVDVNGVHAHLGPGVTRVWLHQRHISSVRVTLTHVRQPSGNTRGSGGFREIRIPGVRVRELLRPPVLAAGALIGHNLDRVALTWIFERTIADQPFELDRRTGSQLLELPENREDPEPTLMRQLLSPAARSYAVDAWVYPSLTVPDHALDRLAGASSAVTLDSSDRFHNQARYRASSAFDGQSGSAWVARWAPISAPPPWVSWTLRRAVTLSRLRLVPTQLPVRRPTAVRVSWAGGSTSMLRVAADGTVRMPRPVRARGFRLTILDAALPHGVSPSAPAVAIGEIVGHGVPVVHIPRRGPLHATCADARVIVGGRLVGLLPRGDVTALDAGQPLAARACRGLIPMGAGLQEIRSLPGPFSVDLLRLRSPGQLPAASGGGAVLSPGTLSNDSLRDARVRLIGPSWLVLGESFSRGWQARCNGRLLGTPRPIDGYANGWPAPASCRQVSFAFAPQRTADAAYVVSAIACGLLCLLVVALRAPMRLPLTRRPAFEDDRMAPLPLLTSVVVAALVTIPLCLLFALRTSVGIFPVLAFALYRGVSARRLAMVAAGLLGVAVPIAYAIASPHNRGGYNFDYSIRTIGAHWIGVLALVLLMLACGRMLIAARRGRPTVESPPAPERPEPRPQAVAGRR